MRHSAAVPLWSNQFRRLSTALIVCATVLHASVLQGATPAQSPLLNRPAKPVAPNVFFTFDDSGSMAWHVIPDTLGANFLGTSMSNTAVYPVLVPEENLAQPNNRGRCIVQTHDANGRRFDNASSSNEGGINRTLYRQFRSSYFNKAYYNPATYYRPWMRPDGTEFPFVTDMTRVPIDPRYHIINQGAGGTLITTSRSNALTNITRTNAAPINGAADRWCNINTAGTRTFSPAIYYNYNPTSGAYTAVDINAGTSFPKGVNRTDCAGTTCTRAEELRNFANWFTYYRTRNFLAIASASRAFAQEQSGIRLGYGRINNTAQVEGAPGTVIRGVRDFSLGTTTRDEFFIELYRMPASGGTPLRRAMDQVGQYFKVKGNIGPWSSTPGSTVSSPVYSQLACRKSYHMLMTDGLWNGAQASTAAAQLDVDSRTGPTITEPSTGQTYAYNPTTASIYRDSWANTLADVAKYYWINDLHDTLANKVPPSRNSNASTDRGDHAFWQHLTTFTISLGVDGTISNRSVVPPVSGWPRPPNGADVSGGAESAAMVDDLWHAAVNGRGQFVLANDAEAFESALQTFLQSIQQAVDLPTGSTVSSTINFSGSGNKRFISEYNSGYWSGDIKAFNIDSQGRPIGTHIWSANDQMPAAAQRNVFTWDPASSSAVAFNTSLPTSLRAAALWGGTAPTDSLINFLRGDRTFEGTTYRCRGDFSSSDCVAARQDNLGRLGDVVNSTPLQTGKSSVDLTYQYLPSSIAGGGSYRSYIARKKARGNAGVVFAGANDGMLHAFAETNGQEVFAFVPNAVLGKLSRLADKQYGSASAPAKGHQFFVDGPLSETDAYLAGAWTNMVLGSTGAGARSVFAIKVNTTSPTTLSAANVAWEFNGSNSSAEANKLGYVMQPLAAGPMMNGQWAAIFGNGPDSPDGGAHLFIVNLSTGAPIKVIQVGATSNNGLSGVTLVRNANQVVVAAYAGDMTGKLWRFDLESTSPGGWKAGWGNKPLYDAGKSITAAPTVVSHPKGGLVVVSGTGRLIYEDDPSTANTNEDDLVDLSTQTLYGIWDNTVIGTGSNTSNATIVRNQLVQQTFSPLTSSIPGDTGSYWSLSRNPIGWTDATSPKKGWYIDLTLAAGQRHVFPAQNLLGIGYVPTIAPLGSTDGCSTSSANQYNILLDLVTGQGLSVPTIDIGNNTASVGGYVGPQSGRDGTTYNPPCQGASCEQCTGSNCGCTGASCKPICIGDRCFAGLQKFVQRNWVELYNYPRN